MSGGDSRSGRPGVAGVACAVWVVLAAVLSACSAERLTPVTAPVVVSPTASPSLTLPSPVSQVETGSERWRVPRSDAIPVIEAYTTLVSGIPGTRVGVRVWTTSKRYGMAAYRIGAYRGGSGLKVWSRRGLPGEVQAPARFLDREARTIVAPWHDSLKVDTTGWQPGFYVFKLTTVDGHATRVPYVVASESADGTVALVAPVATWQAYNHWGGYSLYKSPEGDRRSWMVSYDRPYLLDPSPNEFEHNTVPIIVRAEGARVPLSYFTSLDLHARPGVLDGARGYVSMGHDEYWTPAMRSAVVRARDSGTNLAFLGANTMYWRIRLLGDDAVQPRLQVGYRHDAELDPERTLHPDQATSRFRDAPAAEPENSVVGMLYECFPVDADYRVVTPRWWGFAGLGLKHGDRIRGLVGNESDRVYPNAWTPRPLQVLSHTDIKCGGVRTSAQSTYYTTESGAGVFAAGTLFWGCALVRRCGVQLDKRAAAFVGRVTDNLLKGFARGPVGLRHPALDNVDDFDLAVINNVSAS